MIGPSHFHRQVLQVKLKKKLDCSKLYYTRTYLQTNLKLAGKFFERFEV